MKMKLFSLIFLIAPFSNSSFAIESPPGMIIGWGSGSAIGNATPNQCTTGVVTRAGQILTNAVAVAAGYYNGFTLLSDGTVFGWGYNAAGEATGSYSGADYTNGLVRIDGRVLSNVTAIAGCSLALKRDGTVDGWGVIDDKSRVLGSLSNIVAVCRGLGLKYDGTVVSWGPGFHMRSITVPANLNDVVAVASGLDCLALKRDGTVVEWYETGEKYPTPTGLSNVVAIASEGYFGYHNLALKRDGTVVVWGPNGEPPPAGLNNVAAIAAGDGFSLALKRDGTVVAWGSNGFHQTDVPAGLSNVVAIAAGRNFCLAITTNSAVAESFRQK